MLENVAKITRVVLPCGTVDLRKGIDGLSMIIGDKYKQNPFEKGTLFLFCGRRSDRIKGLLWMGDGFLLLYKRIEWLPLSKHTAQTSLGTTRFFLSIHLPHLSCMIPCSYWASIWHATLPPCITSYEISVRQTRDLPMS